MIEITANANELCVFCLEKTMKKNGVVAKMEHMTRTEMIELWKKISGQA
ncbi:MAG: hypothetical protein AB1420_15880 [Bacillota bacterium]